MTPRLGAKHAGPRLFKRYLQYSKAISHQQDEHAYDLLQQLQPQADGIEQDRAGTLVGGEQSPLADLLAMGLKKRGYDVVREIGDTNYKLDLAIRDENGEFLLGIECEGKNYFNGKSSKEREVYRINLLEYRGWTVVRVWARAWFLNSEKVLKNLEKEIKAAKAKGQD